MLINRLYSRGDTLIEVLFAVTVFSLVAVGGISIMNQGASSAQRSLEITLVRQQIDSQAETLRFLGSSYVSAYQPGVNFTPDTAAGQWQLIQKSIIDSGITSATDFGATTGVCPAIPKGGFILNTNSAKFVPLTVDNRSSATTYSQVRYLKISGSTVVDSAEGIWVQGVRSRPILSNSQSNAGYIDFHIRACWDSPGQAVPVTLGTIVRIYEPR